MKERVIETGIVMAAQKLGGVAWKWISNRRGNPDRIVLLPVAEEHRDIVARYVRFVETKSHTGNVSKQQAYVHGLLRGLGYRVDVNRTGELD